MDDRANVLTVLSEESCVLLPGVELSNMTDDQREWIKATEEDYQIVRATLLLDFSTSKSRIVFPLKQPSDKRWLENMVMFYVRLYELIQLCWEPLKKSQVITRAKEQLPLREDVTPGVWLAFLLRLQLFGSNTRVLVALF